MISGWRNREATFLTYDATPTSKPDSEGISLLDLGVYLAHGTHDRSHLRLRLWVHLEFGYHIGVAEAALGLHAESFGVTDRRCGVPDSLDDFSFFPGVRRDPFEWRVIPIPLEMVGIVRPS